MKVTIGILVLRGFIAIPNHMIGNRNRSSQHFLPSLQVLIINLLFFIDICRAFTGNHFQGFLVPSFFHDPNMGRNFGLQKEEEKVSLSGQKVFALGQIS